jgi:hypothetical protein
MQKRMVTKQDSRAARYARREAAKEQAEIKQNVKKQQQKQQQQQQQPEESKSENKPEETLFTAEPHVGEPMSEIDGEDLLRILEILREQLEAPTLDRMSEQMEFEEYDDAATLPDVMQPWKPQLDEYDEMDTLPEEEPETMQPEEVQTPTSLKRKREDDEETVACEPVQEADKVMSKKAKVVEIIDLSGDSDDFDDIKPKEIIDLTDDSDEEGEEPERLPLERSFCMYVKS